MESQDENLRILEGKVHENINIERQTNGLDALKWNDILDGVARQHAANMVRWRFFSHTDPLIGNHAGRLDRLGILWIRCSENIYKQKSPDNPTTDVVLLWRNSIRHRKNMLDIRMVESGVGIALQQDGTIIIVQDYIRQVTD